MKRALAASLLLSVAGLYGCGGSSDNFTPQSVRLSKIGGFSHPGGEASAEIPAYDAASRRLFMVNGALGTVDVLDLSDPTHPVQIGSVDISAFGAGVNSAAASRGLVALAVEASDKQAPGMVVMLRASDLTVLGAAQVGALPDMVTFTPDGRTVVVANEGEPSDDYQNDPEGSISIVDVRDPGAPVVRNASFAAFESSVEALKAQGVRVFGPNATLAQDLEPEYVAVSADGGTAWVTLQENNALAVVDIASATVTAIRRLGFKDHSLAGNELDASDRDDAVNIRTWPVFGMYQPDAIARYEVGGETYLITANEGDSRDYGGFSEESRVNGLTLDPTVFTDAVCGGPCSDNARLGRLTVTTTLGDADNDGRYEALYAFGGRSFSIWRTDGSLAFDSGSALENLTQSLDNVQFNASNDNNDFDNRSDNKGPEPEGVAVARFGDKRYAFIGLERVGGVMAWDVTHPEAPVFVDYLNTRNGEAGDLGPEGILYVSPADSPNGEPLLIVGNEVSGTTAILRIERIFEGG